jgi:hypothetical protein
VLLLSPFLAEIPCAWEVRRETRCFLHLKMLSQAMQMYLGDHDHRFPPSDVAWERALAPYGMEKSLRCPADRRREGASYRLNPALRGRSMEEVMAPEVTIMFFESSDGGAVAYRHHDGAYYAMVDGHVVWRRRGWETDLIWESGRPSPRTAEEGSPPSEGEWNEE